VIIAGQPPLISVGLPVYNGEAYLDEAIQSVLSQVLADLELVICDNASTDRTMEICRRHAGSDRRVRYLRGKVNIGANRNYNLAARLARGTYFKWMAADDRMRPDFLSRCVTALLNDRTVVLVTPEFCDIDEHGTVTGGYPYDLDLTAASPVDRFARLMCTSQGQRLLYGVMRRDALLETRLLADFYGSDRPLLAKIVLRGRVVVLPGIGWESREHPGRSPHHRATAGSRGGGAARDGLVHLKIAAVMLDGIARSPLSNRERITCVRRLAGCIYRRRERLASAIAAEVRDLVLGICTGLSVRGGRLWR